MSSLGFFAVLGRAGCLALAVAACSSKSAGPAASGDDSGSPGDGSFAGDAPLACPPARLDEWHAGAYHHAQAAQPSACAPVLLGDYYASCLGPDASQSACNQSWGAGEDPPHATCQTCILTPASASVWGPLVDYAPGGDGGGGGGGGSGGTVSVNVAGCVELLDPSEVSCAMSAELADECQHAACDGVCPVSDGASFADWQACIGASGGGVCEGYLQSAACVGAEDAGPAAPCVTGRTFKDEFFAIAAVFCGGGAPSGD